MAGESSRRRMAVPTFLRVSTTISPMHNKLEHCAPLFEGWRRCWLYACKLSKVLRHLGFLQTIPTSLEWPDCMLKICNTSSKRSTFKLCTTNFISWILHWQQQRICNKKFQCHHDEKQFIDIIQRRLINHSRLAWVKDFIDVQTNTCWSVLQQTSELHDWNSLNRNFANGIFDVIVYFFEMLGPGEIRHILKRQQCPFVDIGILKVLVRWMKQSCAINVLISNLKLSLIHFCLINWCLNGCFIPFRNKTMHCIVSSWLMCLIQYSLNFEGFD